MKTLALPSALRLAFPLTLPLTIGALCLCGSAVAQTPSPDEIARAEALEAEADAALADGDGLTALHLLQEAWRAAPLPGLVANQGVVLEQMGEYARAVEKYRRYLELAPEAALREVAELKIDQLMPEVMFATEPPGAEVFVDGVDTPLGLTPMRARLVIGPHFAEFRLAGHEPAKPAFTLQSGRAQSVRARLVRLEPAPANAPLIGPSAQETPDRAWAWAALGGATAAGVAAVALGFMVRSEVDSRDSAPDLTAWHDRDDRAKGYATAAWITGATSLVVGGAAYWLFEAH